MCNGLHWGLSIFLTCDFEQNEVEGKDFEMSMSLSVNDKW